MLNNLRIGKKLGVGFGLLTLLLLAIGIVSCVALLRIDEGTTGTLNQIEIFRKIADATVESYEAQLGSGQHSMTRDSETWAQVVTDRTKAFNENVNEALKRISDPKVKQAAEDAIDKAGTFDNLDTDYANILADLTKTTAVRDEYFAKVDGIVNAIAAQIDILVEQGKKTEIVDGVEKTFIDNDMADAIALCTKMLESTERMQFRAVLAVRAFNPTERETAVKELGEALETGFASLNRVKEIMKDDKTTQDLTEQCATAVGIWVKAINDSVGHAKRLDGCLAEQNTASDATGSAIRDVLDGVNGRITTVSQETETLIATVKVVLLVAGILSVLAAIVCAWVITRNITGGIGKAVSAMNVIANDGLVAFEIPPFDRLTREQQIAAVSEIAAALFLPDYPAPEPAAYRSATVAAVFRMIEHCIQAEVFENTTVYRGFALLAHAEMYGEIRHGVDGLCTELRLWKPLVDAIRKRILDDQHLEVADEINDLPPESADAFFREFRIERNYFIAQPPDPRIDRARVLVTGTLDLCRSVLMKKVLERTEDVELALARAGNGADVKDA